MREVDSFDSRQLKSLIDEMCNLNSSFSDKESLLLQIVKSAMALLLCESGSFFLVDKITKKLCCACSVKQEFVSFGDKSHDSNAVADWVVKNKERLVFRNEASSKEFFSSVQIDDCAMYSNLVAMPFFCDGKCGGAIILYGKPGEKSFKKNDCNLLEFFLKKAGQVYSNAISYFDEKIMCTALLEAKGESSADFCLVPDILDVIDEIAKTGAIVLVCGEKGTGKEIVARKIHEKSPRRAREFFMFNCSLGDVSMLDDLLAKADGSTLFFDCIENLSVPVQERLFEFIKSKTVRKRGTEDFFSADVRIIASAGKNLLKLVDEGKFISGLYYRLSVFPLNVPPLRERKAYICNLAEYFLKKSSVELGKKFRGFSEPAMNVLTNYYWPGNIRELKNAVERACIKSSSEYIQVDDFGRDFFRDDFSSDDIKTVAEEFFYEEKDKSLRNVVMKFKSFYVKKVLVESGWNQTAAGKLLGVQRTYVSRLLKDLDLR